MASRRSCMLARPNTLRSIGLQNHQMFTSFPEYSSRTGQFPGRCPSHVTVTGVNALPAHSSVASADTHPALTAAARVVLRELFSEPSTASLLNCGGAASWLRAQLATLCRCAKSENLPIDQFLVVVKRAWFSLPQLRFRLGDESDQMLALVLRVCVEEYFASPLPSPDVKGVRATGRAATGSPRIGVRPAVRPG